MDTSPSPCQKSPNDEQGVLSPEKLLEKYKSALGIAQKAKNARDEAIKNNKLLQNENEQLKERVVTLDRQYKTAEEMLAALTDQKLKLAMEIDDLKKEKRIYFEELKSKEGIAKDAEQYKIQCQTLLKDNQELILSSEGVVTNLKKDNDEIKKQNEAFKQLCNNIQMEKSELEKKLNQNLLRIKDYDEAWDELTSALSRKYGKVANEIRSWIEVIETGGDFFGDVQLLRIENESLISEKEKMNLSIISLNKDKENMEQEIIELNERINKMCRDLDVANADRDKMLYKLEEVNLETRQLIENSEVLTKELKQLKDERTSMEHTIIVLKEDKSLLNKTIEEKNIEIMELSSENKKLLDKIISFEFEKEEVLPKDRSLNVELHSLQEDLQAFSAEIEKYKAIAKESDMKLQKMLIKLSEKDFDIVNKAKQIVQLESKIRELECSQVSVINSLSETKKQLLGALEELEVIDNLKETLLHEYELKNQECLEALHKAEIREYFVKNIVEGMEELRSQLKSIHEINSLDEEFSVEYLNPEELISGLKKTLDSITSRMHQKYSEDIDNLNVIINEYQKDYETLVHNNDKLSKQAKDILNEQANYDSDLVQKLKTFKEGLLQQIQEKQTIIGKLENEVSSLNDEIDDKIKVYVKIESDYHDLKHLHEDLMLKREKELNELKVKTDDLERQYCECLSDNKIRIDTIANLEIKINDLQNSAVDIENKMRNQDQEIFKLSDAINGFNSGLEKENKDLKNMILRINCELNENLNKIINENNDKTNIGKGYNELKIHKLLVTYLSNEFDNFKANDESTKQKMKLDLSRFHDENLELTKNVTQLTSKINELKNKSLNIVEAIKLLVELCQKNEFSFNMTEIKHIIELVPSEMKDLFSDIEVVENTELSNNLNKKELENKILNLDLLLKNEKSFNQGELEKREAINNKLENELDTFKKKYHDVSDSNDSLNSCLNTLKDDIEKLKSEHHNKHESLNGELVRLELDNCKLGEQITDKNNENILLNSNLSNLISGFKTIIDVCQKEEVTFRPTQIKQITEMVTPELKELLVDIRVGENESKNRENKLELEKKINELETMSKNKDKSNQTIIENKNSLLKNLQLELNSLKKKVVNLSTLNVSLKSEFNTMKDDFESLISEINIKNDSEQLKLKQDNVELTEKVTHLTNEISELKHKETNLNDALKNLINLCQKQEIQFTSKEIEFVKGILPSELADIFSNIQIIENDSESPTHSSKLELEIKIKDLESLVKDKEVFYKAEVLKSDSKINSLESERDSLKTESSNLALLNDSLNSNLSNFKENLEQLRSKYKTEKNNLIDDINKLKNELKDCQELLDFKGLDLKENNRIWAGRFFSFKVALMGLNKTRKEIRNQFECVETSFNSLIDEIREPLQEKVDMVVQNAVAESKAELISEMHQMNQALKDRGEIISKLEFTVTDCHAKMKQLTAVSERLQSELVQAKTELQSKEDMLKEKNQLIKQLEKEIEQLKESHDTSTTDNDVLSTSTISRTEEHSRLRDVEESFEDKYSKLKLLAIKFKKNAAELTHTLESERTKFGTERTELQEKISSMSMAVKNAQKIQELFDESLDERDKLKKDNNRLKKEVEELKNSEENLNGKITSLESNNQSIPVMKKHIDSLNSIIKDNKSELQKLTMEIKAEAIKYEEVKKGATKFETTIQELTRQLELAKQQGKNSNVIELEMKNYEKIIADLSSQLNMEKTSMKRVKSENEALSNVKVGLEDQISIIEKQIAVEQQRINDLQTQVTSYQSKIEEKNSKIEKLNDSINEVQKKLSDKKIRNEALTLEMSSVTSDFSKKEIEMLSKISSYQDQIRSLDASLQSTKQELLTSKREIDHINEEYEGYKLRAQTILAKKKGDLVTHSEKEAKEACDSLKRECGVLEERLDSCMSEIDTLNTRISSLNLEKARSDKRYEEVKSAYLQKSSDYDILSTEFYNFKMKNDLTQEHLKAELTKKKNEYQSELSHFKKTIDGLMVEFKQKEEEVNNKEKVDSGGGYALSSIPENMLPSFEREDGEGSESVPSPKARRNSGIVPLDVLLNSPDESKVIVLQEQVEKLQKDMASSDIRSRHLASLLSEAEKDAARNLHQNKVLKEEVRRLERAVDRLPHMVNTEYLKNIIFQFVTLTNGDERSRLVPVLDTLLKFSPEEMSKLTSVAKGEAQAGWASYLQSLTGL